MYDEGVVGYVFDMSKLDLSAANLLRILSSES